MPTCPCCSGQLIRQIHHHKLAWFCFTCWQEMPNLTELLQIRASGSLLSLDPLSPTHPD